MIKLVLKLEQQDWQINFILNFAQLSSLQPNYLSSDTLTMQTSKPSCQQRPSLNKQNVLSQSTYQPTDRLQSDNMLKQFQTLKQINRILDSNPQSQYAKDQKIRSLVVMFKRQLDINKKLESHLGDYQKKVEGIERELMVRNTQVSNYEKTIFEQKQAMVNVNSENKRLLKVVEDSKEEIKVREELIQKMKQTFDHQKYSMENQLHYLKQKTLHHFTEKLHFPIESWPQNINLMSKNNKLQRSKSRQNSLKTDKEIQRSKSGQNSLKTYKEIQRSKSRQKSLKRNKQNSLDKSSSMPRKNSSKKDMIRRNILAISKKENELMSGQTLLKKFQQTKLLSERMSQIRKGNYHSAMGISGI